MHLSSEDIQRIANTLKTQPTVTTEEIQFKLHNSNSGSSLTLTINPAVQWQDTTFCLVSVLTPTGIYQLHHCTDYVIFEEEEVIFIAHPSTHFPYLSTMTVGANATCSVFTTVHQQLLQTDFAHLDERLLLAAMQLAIFESLLFGQPNK